MDLIVPKNLFQKCHSGISLSVSRYKSSKGEIQPEGAYCFWTVIDTMKYPRKYPVALAVPNYIIQKTTRPTEPTVEGNNDGKFQA